MIFDLNCKLTSWTQNEASDSNAFSFFASLLVFLDSLQDHINDWDGECECLSLTSLGSNDHVNVCFKIYKRLSLDNGGSLELINDK